MSVDRLAFLQQLFQFQEKIFYYECVSILFLINKSRFIVPRYFYLRGLLDLEPPTEFNVTTIKCRKDQARPVFFGFKLVLHTSTRQNSKLVC